MTSEHPSHHTPKALITLLHVNIGHGKKLILSNVSLTLYQGRHLAILGANGAGKSTLLQLLHGNIRPFPLQHEAPLPEHFEQTSNQVIFQFADEATTSVLAAKEHVRLVSPAQQAEYIQHSWLISGQEVIASGFGNAAMLYGDVDSKQSARALELAEKAAAQHLLHLTVPAMSQGQLRLLLILRALVARPALLLLDEPYDGLDAHTRATVTSILTHAAQQGTTIIITAHAARDIPPFVQHGLIVEKGGVREMLLGEGNSEGITPLNFPSPTPLPSDLHTEGTPEKKRLCQFTFSVTERAREQNLAKNTDKQVPAVLQLTNVSVFIERVPVLFDISWTIQQGERWIVTGSNGAGKSTLLRLIYGDETAAYGGTITWHGGPRPALEELRRQIGYVSDRLQHTYEYSLSGEDVVLSGLYGSIGLYHSPTHEERARARYILTEFGLEAAVSQPFHSLSGGMARRVLLARAVIASPSLLLLDEPCSGLDAKSRTTFLHSLNLLAQNGTTMLYVSHGVKDADTFFTHRLHLEHGRIVGDALTK